ncbi:MAG: hypothetical protein LBQ88_14855 [Treponema sp.]|jgi:hypothetical protein|nr:hypothetical protein [Treponema sp.]
MKKILLAGIIGLLLCVSGVFADHPGGLGIGIVGRANVGYHLGFGPGLSLKVSSLPVYWGVNLSIGDGYFNVGVTGDYYFYDKSLVPEIFMGWFLGVGGYGNLYISDGFLGLQAGARVPIGLNWLLLNNFLEIFIDVAPSLGFQTFDPYFPDWGFPFEIGLRVWL